MDNITAIILAAGKGKRMNSVNVNKVALSVNGEPMIVRTLTILKNSGITHFVVVVGFAKDSILALLPDNISIAEQTEQLGTGDAVRCALQKVDGLTQDVLIVNGDDSFLYAPETFQKLYETHRDSQAKITLVTMESDHPTGFGRILRDSKGEIVGIVEEKNATDVQREIPEINLGCYIVDKRYLEENIDKISKNPLTGEYYITDIVDIATTQKGKVCSYTITDGKWQGINTHEDLIEAEKLLMHG